ncbi:SAV_915 family protein [Streptomyces roseifaciens]|uniref:SAV_915 family protein n=1 Tax=Streptomyces roseifaciens TaxID=1488406 RepID=UPI000B0C7D2A|nr:SAV_915 family protein [Streptomyces roseifaciens]
MHLSRTPAEAAAVAAASGTAAESPQSGDGEPSEPSHPAGRAPEQPLYVPVRRCACGFALRVFRSPLGTRTAVAFTTERRLSAVLGPDQPSVRLALPAVRALATPLGVATISIDPQLTAPPVRANPAGPPLTALSG